MTEWRLTQDGRVVDEAGHRMWCTVCVHPVDEWEFKHDEWATCQNCEETMHKGCGSEHGKNEWYCEWCEEELGDTIDEEAKT
jgi:hypothetical protein